MVDADPQSSLTFYLGHEVGDRQPTLLEVLKKDVVVEDGIYSVTAHSNLSKDSKQIVEKGFAGLDMVREPQDLWLIPSDAALDKAQEFLLRSGIGAMLLRQRLGTVADLFDFCLIDSPPQRSQICLSALGAADCIIVPVEASSKGLNALMRFFNFKEELQHVGAIEGNILGILPFRDKWVGQHQVRQSFQSIDAMKELAGSEEVLPAIPESEQYKKAIDAGITLAELGYPKLEYPFVAIVRRLSTLWKMPSVG